MLALVDVRGLRKARGWSQGELARRSGLTVNAISSLERGETRNPTLKTIAKLAAAFGVSELDLLAHALDDEPEPERVALA